MFQSKAPDFFLNCHKHLGRFHSIAHRCQTCPQPTAKALKFQVKNMQEKLEIRFWYYCILLYVLHCFADPCILTIMWGNQNISKLSKNQGEPTCDSMILYATWNTQGNKLPPSTETSLGAGSPVRAPASRPPGRRKAVARGSKDVVGCRMMPG